MLPTAHWEPALKQCSGCSRRWRQMRRATPLSFHPCLSQNVDNFAWFAILVMQPVIIAWWSHCRACLESRAPACWTCVHQTPRLGASTTQSDREEGDKRESRTSGISQEKHPPLHPVKTIFNKSSLLVFTSHAWAESQLKNTRDSQTQLQGLLQTDGEETWRHETQEKVNLCAWSSHPAAIQPWFWGL